jgi:UDP-glucose 4-epimerase
VDGTLRLARLAVESSVKRFVFISSIKVNGEETSPGRPYSATDAPAPVDPYGISKDEAERGLRAIARETGLEVVVVRPVLVYGPGVKGNFRLLVRCLKRGLPLPLGAVDNRRSLVALDNLVDLVVRCVSHPAAANQTFLVSDGEDMSTTALLRRTAAALGKPARLLPVPATILRAAAAVTGHREAARRLLGSLQVDITATCSRLDWSPPISVDEGLRRAVAGE